MCWAAGLSQIEGHDVVSHEAHRWDFPAKTEYTVVVFISAKCPCSESHEPLLKDLQKDYSQFTFIGVHSNADEDKETTQKHFQEVALPFPVIQDTRSHLANNLGALKTPHAYVLNQKGEVVYQGGVTDSHVGPNAKKQLLREVLEDLSAGKTPRHKEGRALGCYIQRENE